MGWPRRRRRDPGQRGQTLVEFALVVPLIVFMVAAFVDMGRAVWSYTQITNAARQGARVAAVNQLTSSADCDESVPITDPSNAHWTIVGCAVAAGGPLGLSASDVAISYAAPPSTTLTCSPTVHVGCIVSVTVTYQYDPSTPFLNGVIHSMTFTSTSQMPVERVFP